MWAARLPKVLVTALARSGMAPINVTPIEAAMRAYSMAVAPESSLKKFTNFDICYSWLPVKVMAVAF
jgi:hypothetical protein